jgi:hypothetical protein
MQPIRDWLEQPIILSEVLPYAVMGGLLILALAGLAGAFRPARDVAGSGDNDRPNGFFARWFRTMRLAPGEDLLVRAIFAAFAVLFVLAIATAFVLVSSVLMGAISDSDDATPTASLGLGALVVALLTAPFLIWRSVVAQGTLDTARDGLFNDRINQAAKDLAARRQVTKPGKSEEKENIILTEWEDDLVTRTAAIDRLEGLALEAMARGDLAPAQRIARMLSIYVQELSRERPAKCLPDEQDREALTKWHLGLRLAKRLDMERAVQSLGRINPANTDTRMAFNSRNIDLRRCNLQSFDLHRLNFQGAQFEGVELQLADLSEAQLQGANLRRARMEGANLKGAQMHAVNLHRAKMTGANLSLAVLSGATLNRVGMKGTNLTGVQMAADTELRTATLTGAAAISVDASTLAKLRPYWPKIIVCAEILPKDAPSHWVRTESDKNLGNWRRWARKCHPDVIIAPDWPL